MSSEVVNLGKEEVADSLEDDGHPDDLKEGDDEETRSFEDDPGSGPLEGGEDDSSGFDGVSGEEVRVDDRSEGRAKGEKGKRV